MTSGKKLGPIPEPEPVGKRTLRCREPGCNRRFTSANRYRLHWRIVHDPNMKERG